MIAGQPNGREERAADPAARFVSQRRFQPDQGERQLAELRGMKGDPALRAVRKRRQILDGARPVFLERGYAAACMNDVAALAGVSKGTVYQHFGSKEALLRGVVIAEAETISDAMPRGISLDSGDQAEALAAVREQILAVLRAPPAQNCMRLVIGSAVQAPAIQQAFLTHALEPTIGALAADLEAVDTHRSLSADLLWLEAGTLMMTCVRTAVGNLLIGGLWSRTGATCRSPPPGRLLCADDGA